MSLKTHSSFFFGHTITELNNSLDFDEGGSELQATLNTGSYSFTEFLAEIKRAMEAATGAVNTYTVSASRVTGLITISADANFNLRPDTGSRFGTSAFLLIGFTGSDQTGSDTYQGDTRSGSIFIPQFFLQDYISPDDIEEAVDASLNESASGRRQVFLFGVRRFCELNIRYQTNEVPTAHPDILSDSNGVLNLRTFMQYIRTLAPIEFMEDKDTPSQFVSLELESTPDSEMGVGFKLYERHGDQLPGYFDTGILKFRVRE